MLEICIEWHANRSILTLGILLACFRGMSAQEFKIKPHKQIHIFLLKLYEILDNFCSNVHNNKAC